MTDSLLQLLQRYWKHTQFRPVQQAVITSVLNGFDTLALLPTGGGKSLCYQLPALAKEGFCLVVSPLIALMKDQVASLEAKGIPAIAIHSGLTWFEVRKALQQAASGSCKLLYVSPERLVTRLFLDALPALQVNLLAVDEAHCISQWGYDFRPLYLRIAELRKYLPGVPVLALTASATPPVQEDIMQQLLFRNGKRFSQSFERPNLAYTVNKTDSKHFALIQVLEHAKGSSIVYCKNRIQTKKLAHLLNLQGIRAHYYHAGLTQEERSSRQNDWMRNSVSTMVCTNAFGMGIDKPDVRTVIHFDVPDCLESYYQEAGRAGRDGHYAQAILLYHSEDAETLKALPDQRFPAISQIKKVYQSLSDFLNIPAGIGEGLYYDFDLNAFLKNFKLEPMLVANALKMLEREGHLSFNETIFLPAQIAFVAGKVLLDEFVHAHPHLDPLVKCLLRMYEGIMDYRVSVSEKKIAKLLRLDENKLKEQLLQLQAFRIIEYLPQKDTPQIHFLFNRAPAEYLSFNAAAYLQRKQQFAKRVQCMLDYIQLEHVCRSKFIAAYFGDGNLPNCGHCDNCLQRQHKPVTPADFEKISTCIYESLPVQGTSLANLLQLIRFPKEQVLETIAYLQSERLLQLTDAGTIIRS